jgi:hypothetical protein
MKFLAVVFAVLATALAAQLNAASTTTEAVSWCYPCPLSARS